MSENNQHTIERSVGKGYFLSSTSLKIEKIEMENEA